MLLCADSSGDVIAACRALKKACFALAGASPSDALPSDRSPGAGGRDAAAESASVHLCARLAEYKGDPDACKAACEALCALALFVVNFFEIRIDNIIIAAALLLLFPLMLDPGDIAGNGAD